MKTNRYIYAQNFTSFKNYLLEEQNQLDKYINFVESNDKINNLSEIDLETQKLEKEFQIQKQNNILEIQKYSCIFIIFYKKEFYFFLV